MLGSWRYKETMGTVRQAMELQNPAVQLTGWTTVGPYAGPQAGRWTGHIHTQGTYPGTDCHHPLVIHHLTLPTLKYIFRLWEAVIHYLLNHYLILNPLR